MARLPSVLLLLLLTAMLGGCAEALDAPPSDMAVPHDERAASKTEVVAAPAATPRAEPAGPAKAHREPVVVSGHLPAPDVLYLDQGRCGSTSAVYSVATRGIAWQTFALPANLDGWTVRMDVVGYAFMFDNKYWHRGTHPTTVPTGATWVRVCNYASTTGFNLHFMPPELMQRVVEDAWVFTGRLAAPPPDVVYEGRCVDYMFPYSSVTASQTIVVLPVAKDAIGQPFLVEGRGAVVQFSGTGSQQTASPLGIVPAGASHMIVCSTSSVDMAFDLRIAKPHA